MKIGFKIFLFATALTLLGFLAGSLSVTYVLPKILGLLVLVTLVSVLFSRHLAQPIQQLLQWLNQFSENELKPGGIQECPDEPLDAIALRQDEIGKISRKLQSINAQFSDSIRHLQQTAVEKERMETELRIGRSIQMDLLALGPANFPKHPDLEISAYLLPAKEVGGDFYDCYFAPEQLSNLLREYSYRFCFCIGDTSGKGVPAALFTTVMKTMIKSQSYVDPSPAKILTRVNQIISENNPSCMFTTIFLGVLNVLNGELTYTRAGHNPPYIRHADGTISPLEDRHGPPLGIFEVEYQESTILVKTGDMFISYTDGITEAMDIDGNFFSDQRLLELISFTNYDLPQEIIDRTTESVREFQGEAEQADDITMLSFKYLGSPIEAGEFSEFSILEAALSTIKKNALPN